MSSGLVAADWDTLVSGDLDRSISVSENAETISSVVWTGTLANGQPALGSSSCIDWNDGPAFELGGSGISDQHDAGWSFFDQNGCGSESVLYCFED